MCFTYVNRKSSLLLLFNSPIFLLLILSVTERGLLIFSTMAVQLLISYSSLLFPLHIFNLHYWIHTDLKYQYLPIENVL